MVPNPRDSMKSTWRHDKTTWSVSHHLISLLAPAPKSGPKHAKTDKVPVFRAWTQDLWNVLHASWPILLQYLHECCTRQTMPLVGKFLLFTAAFQLNSIHEINVLARIGSRYGYLDGDQHARDDVPDVGVSKALAALLLTTTVRPLFTVILTRNFDPWPTLWLPVEVFSYSLVLDFFFYFYHRACHEVDFLWQFHRTHHLTKHPSPLLSAYADHEQEFIEIALVPMLSWAVLKYLFMLPMTFHDWWICHEFIIFSEAMGHSGIRVFSSSPGMSRPFLQYLGCELAGEDHDLHHRKGYRKSYNYGKQTLFWDKLFESCIDRQEMRVDNLDRQNTIDFPLL